MKKIERVSSLCGKRAVEVIQNMDGTYSLQMYSIKYDSEEGKAYEIRELPDPTGKYGDFSAAILEAKSLLK